MNVITFDEHQPHKTTHFHVPDECGLPQMAGRLHRVLCERDSRRMSDVYAELFPDDRQSDELPTAPTHHVWVVPDGGGKGSPIVCPGSSREFVRAVCLREWIARQRESDAGAFDGAAAGDAQNYEIGGVCVRMNAAQAARWNRGETTEQDERRIRVCVPDRYAVDSHVANGEVVVETPRLVEFARELSLREARHIVGSQMEGMPANRIE